MATRSRKSAIDRNDDQMVVHFVMGSLVAIALTLVQTTTTPSAAAVECPVSVEAQGITCQ